MYFVNSTKWVMRPARVVWPLLFLVLGDGQVVCGQQRTDPATSGQEQLLLKDFRPRSSLKNIKFTDLKRARFPVVDVHTHFGRRQNGTQQQLDEFVAVMNRHNIAVCNSLDALLGDTLSDHLDLLWSKHRNRFTVFAQIDWKGRGDDDHPETWDCHQAGFARRVAEQLKVAKTTGISGVKIFKGFGLTYKNPNGSLIQIDDPRWDPIWAACGELGLVVIIHTGDPAAFFQPIDRFNERYEELARRPGWSFFGEPYPSRQELLAARNRVIEKHKKTIFIGAHLAGNPEDLKTVGGWLDQYPNLYVEPASRIAELGRQPYTSREFIIKYQDRILFGTDGPWPELRLTYYWRFFETRDEYFPYSEKVPPPQGFWQIYGIALPDQVLEKLYYQNVCRLIPNLSKKYQEACRVLKHTDVQDR